MVSGFLQCTTPGGSIPILVNVEQCPLEGCTVACKALCAGSGITLVQTIIHANLDYGHSFQTAFPASALVCLLSALITGVKRDSSKSCRCLTQNPQMGSHLSRNKGRVLMMSYEALLNWLPPCITSVTLLILLQTSWYLFVVSWNIPDERSSWGVCTCCDSKASFLPLGPHTQVSSWEVGSDHSLENGSPALSPFLSPFPTLFFFLMVITLNMVNVFLVHLDYCLFPPLERKLHEGSAFCLFFSWLYPQGLKYFLAHRRRRRMYFLQ